MLYRQDFIILRMNYRIWMQRYIFSEKYANYYTYFYIIKNIPPRVTDDTDLSRIIPHLFFHADNAASADVFLRKMLIAANIQTVGPKFTRFYLSVCRQMGTHTRCAPKVLLVVTPWIIGCPVVVLGCLSVTRIIWLNRIVLTIHGN